MVGRNRDAHAWAEAYDEESKQWFPVESTPGRLPRHWFYKRDLNLADDNASLLQDQIGLDDGWLRNSIDWILSIRLSEPIVLLICFTQLPLFVVLVFTFGNYSKTPASMRRKNYSPERC